MNGIIYLIINLEHLSKNINPVYYIGSKKDKEKFDDYWGSSKLLSEHIELYGKEKFRKVILDEITFTDNDELLALELKHQENFNVLNSECFYNRSLVNSGWFHDGRHTKETVWIHNDKENKRVPASIADSYIDKGYILGRKNFTFNRDRTYINDGVNVKSIKTVDLPHYLDSGWSLGRLQGNQKGKIRVNNSIIRKLISEDELEYHLANNWTIGWFKG